MIASHTFNPWKVLLLAIALGGASFAMQGRQGINLADEGFLWYGAQQTAHGKVPLRDFQSYDPGRYYWSAAGMRLFGDGVVSLRFSETLFQILGLWVGLLAARRVIQNWALLAAVGVMLTIWMFPSHKLFDHVLLLFGIWIAVRLIEEPSLARIFVAGFFAGLCVFFGRNHALYNFLAQASLLLFLHFKLRPPLSVLNLGVWLAGIMVGLVPTITMFVCVRGFFASYIESVWILRYGSNLALPVPWPWGVSPSSLAGMTQFLLGIFLVALPLGYLAAIIVSLFMRSQMTRNHALLIACAFVGVFYLPHAFSRADLSHLAQAIHPFTLGALALLGFLGARKVYYWPVIAVLIAAALFMIGRQLPFYQRIMSRTSWVPCDAGDKIFVPPSIDRLFTCLRKFSTENIGPREGVLIAPFTPTLYPILNRQSPVWNLGFFYSATVEQEQAMIQELTAKNVNWAIISDVPPANGEDRRFSVTHKLVWLHLMENFEPVESDCLTEPAKIFHRKDHPAINPEH